MFKKLPYLFVLVVFGICMPAHGFDKKHSQNIANILKIVGKAIQTELGSINKQASKEDIDLAQVGKLIEQELPAIKTKIARVVMHDLTKEQRDLVIDLLKNCKALSATTVDDLMLMAQASSTYERREAMNKATQQYCPRDLAMRLQSGDITSAERIQLYKEFEKIDLHDASFNATKNFMCKSCCVEDISLMATVDLNGEKQALLVQQ